MDDTARRQDQQLVPAGSTSGSTPDGPAVMPTWRVTVVGVVVLLVLLGQLYLVLPLVPQLRTVPGAGPGAASAVMTAFALPYAAGFLLLGPLTDRFPPRALATASALVVSAGALAGALAPTFGWLLAARAVQGLGAAPFTPAVMVVIATRVAPRSRLLATSAVVCAGMAAAVVAQVAAQVAGPWLGLRGLMVASAAAAACCALVVRVAWDGQSPAASAGGGHLAALRLLGSPRVLALLVAATCYLTVFIGLYAALQLAPPPGVASSPGAVLSMRAAALPVLVVVPVVAGQLLRWSGGRRAVVALACGAVACWGLAGAAAAGELQVGGAVVGLAAVAAAVAIAAPATVTAVMAAAPQARGAANALYSAGIFGGAALATPFAAAALSAVGPAAAFAVTASIGGALLVLAAALVALVSSAAPSTGSGGSA